MSQKLKFLDAISAESKHLCDLRLGLADMLINRDRGPLEDAVALEFLESIEVSQRMLAAMRQASLEAPC